MQYSTKYGQLSHMFHEACSVDTAASATRLESLLRAQSHHCSYWFSSAIFKLRHGCGSIAVRQLVNGIEQCNRDAKSETQRRQLHSFKAWIDSGARGFENLHLSRYRCEKTLHSVSTQFGTYEINMSGSGSSSVALSSSSRISTDEQAIHVKMSHLIQEARVQSILQAQGIPSMIHFVYGFSDSSQVFGMHNYIAVASAKKKNPHCKILFHVMREPIGKWWQHAKVLLDEIIEYEGTTEFQGQCLTHYAHKADVVRLKAIYERGGIYMDIDTISLRSWAPLQAGNQFVIAEQDSPSLGTVRQGKVYGLCNAGMASVKGSLFAALWLESYQFFRSHGRDRFWDEHSVILPANLTDEYPWLVQGRSCNYSASEIDVDTTLERCGQGATATQY